MVWGQRWIIVLLPILSLISATVSKILDIHHDYFNKTDSVFMVVYVSFVLYYFDAIAAIMKGVAPTLIVGRAAAGHTHPHEEHDESSTVSTIHFQTSSQSSQLSQPSMAIFQDSNTMQSAVFEVDIEAQRKQSDELMVVVERIE
ncbi:uncharacterized protein EV420DRAFT_1484043 [Desarmillaria tabescens]|uniref:Uncharacterized protein n=1 Tax=Armillaria tabescens TaxID=1929756 RepID=A0AA39JTN5_ARMTA|nr:uncharacterized protein EV420DRAFT_1484043 [Desarmillaria tabescens]KAK0446383.1 hypothetical protein EV420DRAFT_1484043 [Desarmillaria tabescens]